MLLARNASFSILVFEHFEEIHQALRGGRRREWPRENYRSSQERDTDHRRFSDLRQRRGLLPSGRHLSATPPALTTLGFLPLSAAAAFLRSAGVSARRSGNTSSRAQEDRPENQRPRSREGHTSTCPRQHPPLS